MGAINPIAYKTKSKKIPKKEPKKDPKNFNYKNKNPQQPITDTLHLSAKTDLRTKNKQTISTNTKNPRPEKYHDRTHVYTFINENKPKKERHNSTYETKISDIENKIDIVNEIHNETKIDDINSKTSPSPMKNSAQPI